MNRIFIFTLTCLFLFQLKSNAGKTTPESKMKVVSVTIHQYQTPVLKGQENNPVFQIQIETAGRKNPLTLREFSLELFGTDFQKDIDKVGVFYSEVNPFLRDGIRFGIPEKPDIYSDDHGKTWLLGGTTPQDQVNECTVAELPDGKLLLNMRNYDRNKKARKISWSENGGLSWTDIQADTALIEPICQASMLFSEANKKHLVFMK